MIGHFTLYKIQCIPLLLIFFHTNDTLNFPVILESVGITFTVKGPPLPLFGKNVLSLVNVNVLLNRFAKVVLKSSYTAARGQSGISLPGRVIVGFSLPFDLLSVNFEISKHRRTTWNGDTYVVLEIISSRVGDFFYSQVSL